MRRTAVLVLLLMVHGAWKPLHAQHVLLVPDRVFDGETMHEAWVVLLDGAWIAAVGPASGVEVPEGTHTRELPGATLLPGLIEGHSHMLLHPYDETSWNDQVLRESRAERAARAATHVTRTLQAGFTTARDLGSEGAGYDDVGIREAIEKGVMPGPRLLVAGPALVATGSYGPKGFAAHVDVPLGAEEADGDDVVRVTRDQIGHGIDVVKVYADYRWGVGGAAAPTFSEAEMRAVVETAASSGRYVAAHASTPEAMRRAVMAGVRTIEHGDGGTPDVFRLMAERAVVWYPTLAAGDAISGYNGWRKGVDPEPDRIRAKRHAFAVALDAGVTIGMGGDVGVYDHGDNAVEMELMVDYGMAPIDVLRAATSVNADTFGLGDRGRIASGMLADLVAVTGNPSRSISAVRAVVLVLKGGEEVRLVRD